MVNGVYHHRRLELVFKNHHKCGVMNANPASQSFDIAALPISDGWRVRTWDGRRLQFIGGFEDRAKAEKWMRCSAQTWGATLNTATERL